MTLTGWDVFIIIILSSSVESFSQILRNNSFETSRLHFKKKESQKHGYIYTL
jgi:hypothetical protein